MLRAASPHSAHTMTTALRPLPLCTLTCMGDTNTPLPQQLHAQLANAQETLDQTEHQQVVK
jgi:hypothetical protein